MKNGDSAIPCDVALTIVTWAYLGFAYVGFERPILDIPVCPWALLTGFNCPLCGSTHFIGRLLHGFVDLEQINVVWLLWFVFVVGLAVFITVRVVKALRGLRSQKNAMSNLVLQPTAARAFLSRRG